MRVEGSGGGPVQPAVSADRFKLRIDLRAGRRINERSIDVGLVAFLAAAVLVQGLVVAFGLPHKVELLVELSAAVLVLWVAFAVVRSGATIRLPYLAIAFAAMLAVAAVRSDELLRMVVSLRNFVLLPALALCLGALGQNEGRNRLVVWAVVSLAVLQFAVTVGQGIAGLDVDLIDGTFGDNSDPSTTFAIITGSCLALGMYGARLGRKWWLAVAVALPLFSVWASVRAALIVAPAAGLAVAVATWWAVRPAPAGPARWRLPLTVAAAAVACGAAITAGYAIARPGELALFTNAADRSAYLRNADIYYTSAHGWSTIDSAFKRGTASAQDVQRGTLPLINPDPNSLYAGASDNAAPTLVAGRTYSFLAAVKANRAGRYHLFAGPIQGRTQGGTYPSARFGSNRWQWLAAQDVVVRSPGQPFFALQTDSGTFTGRELIAIRCPIVLHGAKVAVPTGHGAPNCDRARRSANAGGAHPVFSGASGAPLGREPLVVPGRGTQYKTAARLIDGTPLSFLFGNGLGATTYAANLGLSQPPRADRIAGYSDFGTTVVELGWLGTAIAFGCILALGFGSLAAARRAQPETWTRALLLAYPGVLVAMTAEAFFGTPFRNIGSAAIFWILTGLALASILRASGGSAQSARSPARP
jgi:hypothetical protein